MENHVGAWKNQYVSLVSEKPGYIFAEDNRTVSDQTINTIRMRQSAFEQTFVELGSGSGSHLVELASRHPNTLCIGFELRFKRTFKTGEKAEQRQLDNVIMIRSNARNLQAVLPPHSIDRIYINFPDPWEKKKWLKNRMVNPGFVDALPQLLRPNGLFRYKTDHKSAFRDSIVLIEKSPHLQITKMTEDLYSSEYLEESIPTEFEQLFLSQKLPINFLECAIKQS